MTKRCAVVQGGGNRFHLLLGSVLAAEEESAPYPAFVGVSSGALLAFGRSHMSGASLKRFALGIRRKHIWGKTLLWWLTAGRVPIVNSRPLLKTLESVERSTNGAKYADAACVVYDMRGKYSRSSAVTPAMVLASCSVPPYFPPVGNFIDGGVRQSAPLKTAIDMGYSCIDVHLSSPLCPTHEQKKWSRWNSTMEAIDALSRTVLIADLREAHRRNLLVMAGWPWRDEDRLLDVRVFAPEPREFRSVTSGLKHYLDFRPSLYQRLMDVKPLRYTLPQALELVV